MRHVVRIVLAADLDPDVRALLVREAPADVAALVAADPHGPGAVADAATRDPRRRVRRAGLGRTAEPLLLAAAARSRVDGDAPAALRNPAMPPAELADAASSLDGERARAAAANPSCPDEAAAGAVERHGARLFAPGSDAARLARASALLAVRPELAAALATADDRATRRAVLRLPGVPVAVAEEVIATRASGLHTLARNPTLPLDLAEETPSKRRRRSAIDAVVGARPERLVEVPDPRAVALGSGTIDLLLAAAPGLDPATACALASRPTRPADGWVLATLVERFGADVWRAGRRVDGRDRWAAAAESSPLAAALHGLSPAARQVGPAGDDPHASEAAGILGADGEAWRMLLELAPGWDGDDPRPLADTARDAVDRGEA